MTRIIALVVLSGLAIMWANWDFLTLTYPWHGWVAWLDFALTNLTVCLMVRLFYLGLRAEAGIINVKGIELHLHRVENRIRFAVPRHDVYEATVTDENDIPEPPTGGGGGREPSVHPDPAPSATVQPVAKVPSYQKPRPIKLFEAVILELDRAEDDGIPALTAAHLSNEIEARKNTYGMACVQATNVNGAISGMTVNNRTREWLAPMNEATNWEHRRWRLTAKGKHKAREIKNALEKGELTAR